MMIEVIIADDARKITTVDWVVEEDAYVISNLVIEALDTPQEWLMNDHIGTVEECWSAASLYGDQAEA